MSQMSSNACQSGCGVLALGVCLAHAHSAVSQLRSIDCIPPPPPPPTTRTPVTIMQYFCMLLGLVADGYTGENGDERIVVGEGIQHLSLNCETILFLSFPPFSNCVIFDETIVVSHATSDVSAGVSFGHIAGIMRIQPGLAEHLL